MGGLKCQNGAGMSKLCRYILSKRCRFRKISVEEELDRIIIFSYYMMIERSKFTQKQSEDWLMPTVNPNVIYT